MKNNRKRIMLAIFCILLIRLGFSRVLADSVFYDGSDTFDGNFSYQSTSTWGNYDYTTTKVQDITYAVITCYRGNDEHVIIPSTVGGLEVIGINAETFNVAKGVKKVTLPRTLQVIYDFAFIDCPTIEALEVETGNQYYTSVDGIIYSADEKYLVVCPEGKKGAVNISSTCKNICDYAFYGCEKITSINIPKVMTNIGDLVFNNTASLQTINVETGCRYFSVYDGILYNYSKTILIKCPDKMNRTVSLASNTCEISPFAFYKCYNLPGPLTLPSRIDTIGEYAFADCESLNGTISIPYSVVKLGEYAFADCYSLEGVVIGSGINEVPEGCFSYCSSLETINIPNNITTVGDRAFMFCSGTKNLNLGSRVQTIGENAFYGLKSLRGDLVIPDSVTELKDAAFYGCNSLDGYIIVGKNVNTIGGSQFGNPKNCKGVVFTGALAQNTDAFAYTLNDCKFYYKAEYPQYKSFFENIEPTVLYASKFHAKQTETYNEKPVVTFIANGETIGTQTLQRFGQKATTFEPNLEFDNVVGWYYDSDYNRAFSFNDELMSDTTVYAKTESKYSFELVDDSTIIETDTTQKIKYNAIMRPQDTISWSSDNTAVATVDEEGNVTAHSVGTATITASTIYGSDTILVETWKDNNSLDISLDEKKILIGESTEIPFTCHLVHDGNVEDITWTTDKDGIIQVDHNEILGLAEGTVTLTASYQDVEDSIEITVLRPNELTIVAVETPIIEDKIAKIDFTYFFNDGATDEDIIWSSEDEEIAFVDNGYVTGVAEGKTTITATYQNVSSSFEVEVYPKDKLEFNINGVKFTRVGTPYDLRDYIEFYSYGNDVSSVEWVSSNSDVATITDGVLDVLSPGETIITINYNDLTDYLIVHTIEENMIRFYENSQLIKLGEDELDVSYQLEYADETDESLVQFSTDNESVVKIENNVPKVIGIGQAMIYISYKDIQDSKELNVVQKDTLEIDKTSVRLVLEEEEKINLTYYSYDSELEIVSSNPDVATMDSEGNITALSLGETEITITCGKETQVIRVLVATSKYDLGDVNKDGKINSTDAANILEIFQGKEVDLEAQILADVNEDGKVNSTDATIVLSLFATK